ncbi:MAG: hypothetical protein EOP86_25920 [Verrucomicrobiaceae bacterium]|nr:MAG: hypothetical protein EOP86_25920 [Verrucomicrobiaceae bacterium]
MRTPLRITFMGCLIGGCKPAASPDRKAEAKQEMERLETHREKAIEKATQGTIPKSRPSTFKPVPSPKPNPDGTSNRL